MLSVSIVLLLGSALAIPEPVRTMAFNVGHAAAMAGAGAYAASASPVPATLGGPVGIIRSLPSPKKK